MVAYAGLGERDVGDERNAWSYICYKHGVTVGYTLEMGDGWIAFISQDLLTIQLSIRTCHCRHSKNLKHRGLSFDPKNRLYAVLNPMPVPERLSLYPPLAKAQ